MTNITLVDDHSKQAIDELFCQFMEAENLQDLIRVFGDEMDEIEEIAFQLLTERNIDGVGAQLDILGEIVGEPRRGKTDAEYRDAIRFKIAINTANSTEPHITAAAKILTQATTVLVQDQYPASIQLFTNGINITRDILQFLTRITGATIAPVDVTITDLGIILAKAFQINLIRALELEIS